MISFFLFIASCKSEHVSLKTDELETQQVLTANFKPIFEKIITPKCLSCHQDRSPTNHLINLKSYEEIMKDVIFPPLIVVGNPEESSFYDSIKKGRMPKGGTPLTEIEIQIVYDWIKKGALESESQNQDKPGNADSGRQEERPVESDEPLDGDSEGDEPDDGAAEDDEPSEDDCDEDEPADGEDCDEEAEESDEPT